jgi:hypothetical protein
MMSELTEIKKQASSATAIFEKEIEIMKLELEHETIPLQSRKNIIELISKTRDLIREEEKRVSERLNNDFVQLYRKNIEAIVELGKKNYIAGYIFVYFLKIMGRDNCVVISQNTLTELFEVSRQTIYTAIKALEESKFIQVLKIGTANAYVINADIAWTTYNNKKTTAMFNAKVVASLSEQTEATKKKAKSRKITMIGFDFKDPNTIDWIDELPPTL